MDSALSLDRVAFRFEDAPLLEEVSLEVAPGSFLGLLGPNGAGKTTLLRIAAGLLKPHRGTVSLWGQPLEGMSRREVARQLALLPQSGNLPPSFTARELVLMGRTPYLGFLAQEGAADEAIVDRAMELARCRHLADRRAEELSGGERQRIMMARALAQQPKVLLMDEPTTHMDLRHQIATIQLVVELVQDGLAALGVFHDLNLAACYCSHLAVLSCGRLVAAGTPEEVLTPSLLSEVFQVDLCLTSHPQGGVPAVLPPASRHNGNPVTLLPHGEGCPTFPSPFEGGHPIYPSARGRGSG